MAMDATPAYGPRRSSNWADKAIGELINQSGLSNYRLIHDTMVHKRASSSDPIWPNETLAALGAYAVRTDKNGGVIRFSTGATAGANCGIFGSASWVTALNTQRWGCAFTFSVPSTPAADSDQLMGWFNIAQDRVCGVGVIGAKSTTAFSFFCGTHQATYSAAHATASTIAIDTGDHTGYLACNGTTIYGRIDAEPWVTVGLATFTGQANGLIIQRNEGSALDLLLDVDDALYITPGK